MTLRTAVTWIVLCASVAYSPCALAQARAESSPAPPLPNAALPLPDAPPDATGWGVAGGLRYLEIVRGDAKPNEKLPLLIVIHGLGDKPHHGWLQAVDVDSNIKARMILPQAPTPSGSGFAWFPYRAGGLDQAALAHGIAEAAERLAHMLTVLQKQRPTRGKPVVSGFSQGGMLSYALALTHPELVAYAVPISGMLPEVAWPVNPPGKVVYPPLHALHGTADSVVRFTVDDQLVQRLRTLGYPAELVAFEHVEHAITPEMTALVRTLLSAALTPTAAATPRRRVAH